MATFLDGLMVVGLITVITVITLILSGIIDAIHEKLYKDKDDDN